MTVILIAAPQEAGRMLGLPKPGVAQFRWYYMVVIAAYLVFVVGSGVFVYGKLKLGSKDDTRTSAMAPGWHVVLVRYRHFAVYFGASEPLDHYFNPPEGVPAATSRRVRHCS